MNFKHIYILVYGKISFYSTTERPAETEIVLQSSITIENKDTT